MLHPHQQKLVDIWDRHTQAEFAEHDVLETMKTMTDAPHVHNVAVAIGGQGRKGVHDFYLHHFLPGLPPDTETELLSRTVGETQIVDELIFKFTHSISMPWMLPGVPPTHKRVEIPLVAIIGFKENKVASEHIYWDQASVLVQIGLLSDKTLPVKGIESADQLRQIAVEKLPF